MDEIDVQLKLRKITKKRNWKDGFSFLETAPNKLQSAGLCFLTKTMQQRGDIKKAIKMTIKSDLTYTEEDIKHLLIFAYHHGMQKEYKTITERFSLKKRKVVLEDICKNFGEGDLDHATELFF